MYNDPLNPNQAPQIAQGLAPPPQAQAPAPSIPPPSQTAPAAPPPPAAPPSAAPAPPAAPQMYYDPYNYVAPNSVLNQPQVQDKLTQAFMNMAQSATTGH